VENTASYVLYVMADNTHVSEEQYKFDVITKVLKKEIKPGLASKLLGVSPRQIRRLKISVREYGISAFTHKLKGRRGNHHIDPFIKKKALTVIKSIYNDFKPTFATEKLEENHSIHLSHETTRLWMIEEGLWKSRKQKQSVYHSWRPRKDYFGELLQFDGSYHYWFEKRFVDLQGNPVEVCLLAAIDDATGKITKAEFAPHEGVIPVFTFWKGYVEETGKPISIYLDKFSTYKINHKAAVDNSDLITQFQRVMQRINVQLITAHSPEAKGRVERLFGTLQDRLVKEMRLVGINNPEEGNRFLREVFIPNFNKKFAVVPAKEGDLHKPVLREEKEQIHHIFSIHDVRRINLDFTIQFKNNWYQLIEIQPATVRPLEVVLMETWLDQTVHILLKGHELEYILLPEKPKKQRIKQPVILTTHKLNWKPPANHPWRKYPSK
jgi:hypothetical protein